MLVQYTCFLCVNSLQDKDLGAINHNIWVFLVGIRLSLGSLTHKKSFAVRAGLL